VIAKDATGADLNAFEPADWTKLFSKIAKANGAATNGKKKPAKAAAEAQPQLEQEAANVVG
jgi:hypothetical protein